MNSTVSPHRHPSRGLQAFLLALAALYIILKGIGSIWSDSVDLAHHYALAARIAEYWGLPAGVDPTLGEMNFYPRISHAMAAIAGSWFDSPLIGLQLVSLLSVFVVWASLIYLLWSAPRKLAVPVLATFVGLLVLNRIELRFELFGRELVVSYFYAQLVAQALVAFSLPVAILMERGRVDSCVRYGLLLGLGYFCVGIHVLPALQLLAFLILVICLEFLTHVLEGKGGNAKRAVIAIAFIVASVVAVVRHPAFSAMAEISRNNGAFAPKHFDSVEAIAAYAIFVAIASGLVVFAWFKLRNDSHAKELLLLKYLGLYGIAVAGVCLLQFIALKLGQGSEYAVKKHIFSLNTVLLLELSLAPLLAAVFRKANVLRQPQVEKGFVYAYLLLPLLTILAFHGIAPRRAAHSTVELVKLERVLQRHRDELLVRTPGRFVYLMPGPGVSRVVAYMMTIGVLKSPRGPDRYSNAFRILRGEAISDWPLVGTILDPTLSQAAAQKLPPDSCQRPFPGLPFAVLDGQCLGKAVSTPASFIRLTAGQMSPCKLTGFGAPEQFFTWTTQKQASIECPTPQVDGHPATSVTISAGAFLEHVPFQRAYVSVNDGPSTELRFDAHAPQQSIVLRLPANVGANCRVDFTLPDSISPSEVGVSVDPRRLGLKLSDIEFK